MTAPSPPNLPPKLPADLALDRRAGLPEDLRFLRKELDSTKE